MGWTTCEGWTLKSLIKDRIKTEENTETGRKWKDCAGYKDMTESMGPNCYSCPLEYLEMVPMPESPFAEEWRESVRAWHKKRTRKFTIGEEIKLVYSKIPSVTIVSVKPLLGVYGGIRYRIPKKLIA